MMRKKERSGELISGTFMLLLTELMLTNNFFVGRRVSEKSKPIKIPGLQMEWKRS